MEENDKVHEHRFLAFEPIPHFASKFLKLREAIVEPNIGMTGRAFPALRALTTLLALILAGFVVWFVYDHLSTNAKTQGNEAQISKLDLNSIIVNTELTAYARRTAAPLFAEHCAGCHGEKGEGHQTDQGLFAPVLNDNDWMFEGKIENIYTAIANGSQSLMPAYRRKLSEREISNVAKFVKAMSEGQGDKEVLGKQVFESSGCGDCHGEDATGTKSLGAVNLTDSVWRFEGTLEGIRRTIAYGVNSGDPKDRISSMPSFSETNKLSPNEMKKLAVYVYKLSTPEEHK